MEKINLKSIVVEQDKDFESKMYEHYLASPAREHLLKMGLNDEIILKNIAKVYDFILDFEYCSSCKGLSKCEKDNPYLCTKIMFDNNYIDSQLVPCKKKVNKMLLEKQFYIRDFPYEWLDNTLKNLDQQDYRKLAYKKYSDFKTKGDTSWIFLQGSTNSGRTFLAASLAIDAAKSKRGPVVFASCSTRIRELVDLSFSDKEDFQNEISIYSNIPILVLDDFGNEYKNEHVRDSIIIPILASRVSKKLFTIITSDFSYEELLELYSTNKSGEIRAKQLINFIKKMCGAPICSGDIGVY